jgi:lipoprotein signal peptidase
MKLFNNFKMVLFFSALIFLDQLSKYLIRSQGGFYICNKGIAFGISVYCVVLCIFIIIAFYFSYRILNFKLKNFNLIENLKLKIETYKSIRIAIIFLAAGMLSNVADRFIHGCVIDFIDLKFWPVFNPADTFISIGALILLVKYWKS